MSEPSPAPTAILGEHGVAQPGPGGGEPDPRRWWVLVVIGVGQLMIVLDATIVNVALPSMQADLGFSDAGRQWAVTAYTLAFGGLLLLGGRIADYFGRRRMILIGAIGFAGASALGGAAANAGLLFGARAAQGVFGALLAPALLSSLTVMFTDPKERGVAFGVFSAIAGVGAAVGLVLGGVLTDYLSWRWALYVNIPFAVAVATGAVLLLPESRGRRPDAFDATGAVLATAGLTALVFGFTKAETDGWSAPPTLLAFVCSAIALTAFLSVERRITDPLLPLRVILDRNRAGCYLTIFTIAFCLFGMMFFLTFYLQGVLHWTPVRTGIAFLPMTASIITAAQVSARLVVRVPVRALLVGGLLLASCGLWYLTRLAVDSSFVEGVLPAEILLGLGMGTAMMAGVSTATHRVPAGDAGIAGALVNTSQQIGGSIGTALLNTLAAGAAGSYLTDHGGDPRLRLPAAVHGDHLAVAFAAAVAGIAAVAVFLLVDARGHGNTDVARARGAAGAGERVPAVEPIELVERSVRSLTPTASGPLAPNPGGTDTEEVAMTSTAAINNSLAGPSPTGAVPADGGEPSGAATAGTAIVALVRTEAGSPLLGAAVGVIDPLGAQVAAAEVDTSGVVRLAVAPGRYLIAVTAPDHAPKAAVLEVPVAGVELTVTLYPTSELRGTVRNGSTVVANALVTLVGASGGVMTHVRTDSEGRYRMPAPPDGTWTLIAVAPGAAPAVRTVSRPYDPVVCDLLLGSVARVHGFVRSASGEPVVQSTVRLSSPDGTTLGEQATAADGSFEFTGLSDGQYNLSADGHAAMSQMLAVPDPAEAGRAELTVDITLADSAEPLRAPVAGGAH